MMLARNRGGTPTAAMQRWTNAARRSSRRSSSSNSGSVNLRKVKHVIAVTSCKGGVGKSTVAVNLAASLQRAGWSTGIFDADIYGPSLPTMLHPSDSRVRLDAEERKYVVPLEYEGIKAMSYGWVSKEAGPGAGGHGAAVVRGPMVSRLVQQLCLGTAWGDLDFLILDMPPGTGDIQLSLTQSVSITASVVVTTPHRLSYVDVVSA